MPSWRGSLFKERTSHNVSPPGIRGARVGIRPWIDGAVFFFQALDRYETPLLMLKAIIPEKI
jgi:hypothetical protein